MQIERGDQISLRAGIRQQLSNTACCGELSSAIGGLPHCGPTMGKSTSGCGLKVLKPHQINGSVTKLNSTSPISKIRGRLAISHNPDVKLKYTVIESSQPGQRISARFSLDFERGRPRTTSVINNPWNTRGRSQYACTPNGSLNMLSIPIVPISFRLPEFPTVGVVPNHDCKES